MDFLIKKLQGLKYEARWEIINTKDYVAPQHRRRWYMVAFLRSCVRQRGTLPWFPEPDPKPMELATIVKPLPEAKWLPWPGKNESKVVRNNVLWPTRSVLA